MKYLKITPKKLLILIGALIALSPFLGVPASVKSAVVVILGLSVAALSFTVRHNKLCDCADCVPIDKPGSYVESAPAPLEQKPEKKEDKKSGNPPVRI